MPGEVGNLEYLLPRGFESCLKLKDYERLLGSLESQLKHAILVDLGRGLGGGTPPQKPRFQQSSDG